MIYGHIARDLSLLKSESPLGIIPHILLLLNPSPDYGLTHGDYRNLANRKRVIGMKRPLMPVALCYVSGILLAHWTASLPILFTTAFSLAALAFGWEKQRPLILCLVIALTGWINVAHRTAILSGQDLRVVASADLSLAKVRGTLLETPKQHVRLRKEEITTNSSAKLALSAITLGDAPWKRVAGTIETQTKGVLPAGFHAGQTVAVSGVLGRPEGAFAPGLFDYREFLQNQGIHRLLKVEDTAGWSRFGPPTAPPLADRFTAWSQNILALGLPPGDPMVRLQWALALGWKEAMTDEVSDPFIKASTFHIFAVDGLRIAIVSGIFLFGLRKFGVSRPIRGLLVLPVILCYAVLTGWPASAVRAILMAAVVIVGWWVNRPSDPLNSLFAAAIAILVYDPLDLYQAGFQLSFFVVLCILLIHPSFDQIVTKLLKVDPLLPDELRSRWNRRLRKAARHLLGAGMASLSAWLGSIPLVAYYFHMITPWSVLTNLPTIPACALVLMANLLSLLCGAWFPLASIGLNHLSWHLMKFIELISKWSAAQATSYYYVSAPGLFSILLYYTILISVLTGWLFQGQYRKWKLGILSTVVIAWTALWAWERPVVLLTVLPLRGGHAVFAQAPGTRNDWLIDCGNEFSADSVIIPFLEAKGVNRLTHFLLSHGDNNYVGGATNVLTLFRPRNVLLSPIHFRSPSYRSLESLLQTSSMTVKKNIRANDKSGPWTILHPDEQNHFARSEDNSVVLRGDFHGLRVLLLSGLGQLGQRALMERTNDLAADIVISGPIGEGDPISPLLLEAIHPRAIIIADSPDPTPRRISAAFKERIRRSNIPVIYTREHGTAWLTIRPGSWRIESMDGTLVR